MGRHSRKGPAPQGSDGKRRGSARSGPSAGQRDVPAAPSPGVRDHAAPPAYGTPAQGVPQVRGGHPEHREPGGGWGQQRYGDRQGGGSPAPRNPQQPQGRQTRSAPTGQRQVPGPRREFIDAFDAPPSPYGSGAGAADVDPARWRPDPYAPVTDWDDENSRPRVGSADGSGRGSDRDDDREAAPDADGDGERPAKGALGRTFTGIAAAAVTTVLVVVVAGQVTDRGNSGPARSRPVISPATARAPPRAPTAGRRRRSPPPRPRRCRSPTAS